MEIEAFQAFVVNDISCSIWGLKYNVILEYLCRKIPCVIFSLQFYKFSKQIVRKHQ